MAIGKTGRVCLIGDIGGTNARFALWDGASDRYSAQKILQCSDHATVTDALDAYLCAVGADTPDVISLAAAGPRIDDSINLTNNDWHVSPALLEQHFGTSRISVLNDFEAVAFALLMLDDSCVQNVGSLPYSRPPSRDFRIGVIGPGTGLGAAGLIRQRSEVVALVTEAGHAGFAPETDLQAHVRERLLTRYDRLSDERLVSGSGIANIYWALEGSGDDTSSPSAAEIFQRALNNTDPVATQAVGVFYEILGQVAGNFALSLGAFDGIYLAGGVVQRYPDLLHASAFRSGFESKGRHRALMQRIPTHLITYEHPGLLGAQFVASRVT